MPGTDNKIPLDWDALEVGETFDKFQYVLTQEMIDGYRKGVMDPDASFPTIAHKGDVRQYNAKYSDDGSVNARCAFHCYNPPIAGKKLTVTAWIADKYLRRGKNYIVTEAVPDLPIFNTELPHEGWKTPFRRLGQWGLYHLYHYRDERK